MKVIVKEAFRPAQIQHIENELDNIQKIIGGYIDCITIFGGNICIIVDDEAVLKMRHPNVYCPEIGQGIRGTVIFCGVEEDDFRSLTDKEVAVISNYINLFSIT